MRHGSSSRRQRNRGNGGRRGNQQRTQVYDSNGPDVRIRGTAHQVAEKYEILAKDAASSGDRILAESYLQHAEHYLRIVGNMQPQPSGESEGQNAGARESQQNKPEAQPQGNCKVENTKEEDDLSLPSSILGGDVKPKRTSEQTSEEAENMVE